jgi:hypothetical protein
MNGANSMCLNLNHAVQKALRLIIVFIAITMAQLPSSFAQETVNEPTMSAEVQAWFVALTKVAHPGFNKLIAEDAKIELRDLGIIQTRQEFLDSLDEWEDATKGAILLTQMVSSENGMDIVRVCYRFENNEQLNRETYHYAAGKITLVIQELISSECEGF